LHRQGIWAGRARRLLTVPGDVDGQLCGRSALSVADRRRATELLRLVLRPAAFEPADLGRANRRPGKRRLVQFDLPDAVGLERPANADARRAFLYRGPLQGCEVGRRLPRLFGSI